MTILSETKSNGTLKVKTNKNLFEITLDEKIALCKKYNAKWFGGSYSDKISTLIFKLN